MAEIQAVVSLRKVWEQIIKAGVSTGEHSSASVTSNRVYILSWSTGKVRKGMERALKLMGRLLTKVLLIPTTTMQSRNYHPHNTEARTKVQRGYLVLP